MLITEALEKGFKEIHWEGCACYLEVENQQFYPHVRWRNKSDRQLNDNQAFSVNHLTRTDWLPYSPEPERCEACCRLEAFVARNGEGPTMNDVAFLLQQACTCSKEAP